MNNLSEQSGRLFKQRVITGSNLLGIPVSDDQTHLMERHARELLLWNKRINLTAIKDPSEMAEKHFIDSIAAVQFFKDEKRLLDMGAGGGFPGVPLKIMVPSLRVVMVDASRKKVNFLKHVIRTLHLENIEAIHSRVEDLHGDAAYKNKFDAVISRAFTDLSGFAALAFPFLAPNGTIFAMKGRNADKEVTPNILEKYDLTSHHYQLPFEKSLRTLIRLTAV